MHNVNAFIPFSFGPANCVGKNLAWKQMKMVLCHLMQQVEFRLAEDISVDQWEKEVADYFSLEVGRLPLIATPRK